MSTNPPRQSAEIVDGASIDDPPGAYLEGYDDPVIVKTRLRTDGVYHDADETAREPSPSCRFADRSDRWTVREREFVGQLDKCECCAGGSANGDGAGGVSECPFCEEEVHAVHLPKHIRTDCDG